MSVWSSRRKDEEDLPGRKGFKAGLIKEPPAFLEPPVVVEDLGLPVVFGFAPFAPACCSLPSAFEGVNELSVPSLPKFMMLAGVTG